MFVNIFNFDLRKINKKMILKIRPQTKSETMLDKIREKLDTPFFFL